MSYQTEITIAIVVKDIDSKKYLLPSIQREFVWGTDQIEKLYANLLSPSEDADMMYDFCFLTEDEGKRKLMVWIAFGFK